MDDFSLDGRQVNADQALLRVTPPRITGNSGTIRSQMSPTAA